MQSFFFWIKFYHLASELNPHNFLSSFFFCWAQSKLQFLACIWFHRQYLSHLYNLICCFFLFRYLITKKMCKQKNIEKDFNEFFFIPHDLLFSFLDKKRIAPEGPKRYLDGCQPFKILNKCNILQN